MADTSGFTDSCHHYESVGEVPWDMQKYWQQRHSIWSKYDEGIYMTDDAWFGVTPEPVATHVAKDLAAKSAPSTNTVVDIFAGAGGNAIAFALSGHWNQVIAIERDASVIACARNNATIYGVASQITFVQGDSFTELPNLLSSGTISKSSTVVFASPPWGGPSYRGDKIFDLAKMMPYNLQDIWGLCAGMEVALYLPRTSDLRQIASLVPEDKEKVAVVQYCMEGASKALVAFLPAIEQE